MRDRRGSCSDCGYGRAGVGLRSGYRRCGKRCWIRRRWRHLVWRSCILRRSGRARWWELGIGRAGHGWWDRSGNSDGRSRWRRCCWQRGEHGFNGANQAQHVYRHCCPIAAPHCSRAWCRWRTQRLFQHRVRFGRGPTHRSAKTLRDTQGLAPSSLSSLCRGRSVSHGISYTGSSKAGSSARNSSTVGCSRPPARTKASCS